jgi:hypothetical protein
MGQDNFPLSIALLCGLVILGAAITAGILLMAVFQAVKP